VLSLDNIQLADNAK